MRERERAADIKQHREAATDRQTKRKKKKGEKRHRRAAKTGDRV